MQLVEQHVIHRNHPYWGEIDDAAFASKNLYNLANYHIRQNFFSTGRALSMKKLYATVKDSDAYKALPRKVSNSILIHLLQDWKSYFEATLKYQEHPEAFFGKPRIPRYKNKTDGRNLLIYDIQAISSKNLLHGIVKCSGLSLQVNQFYNKRKATLQSQLDDPKHGTSERIERLTDRRNRRINHVLHTESRRIINVLVKERIGTLVIGKNPDWKQNINLGSRNNQNFVSIPHARFISMLTYKAQLVGIRVIEISESYTSKCSFLDLEPIEKHKSYMGQRIHRGLFRASDSREINADINGAGNIIRKVAGNAFNADSVEGVAVRPKWLSAA